MAETHNPRRRERGSSTAMEQWRKMALKVPQVLMVIGTSYSEAILTQVCTAHGELGRIKVVADLIHIQTDSSGIEPLRAPPGVADLMAARHNIALSMSIHTGAGHGFTLCAERLGLQGGALWEKWDGHRSDVVRHADEAMRRLRSGLSSIAAATDVLLMVRRRPPESPPRNAWTSEASQVLRRAIDEVAMAREAVRQMRHAVVLEFFDAWMVLKR